MLYYVIDSDAIPDNDDEELIINPDNKTEIQPGPSRIQAQST